MEKRLQIAVQIEKNRAHGRDLLKGIGGFALDRADWQLEQVEPRQLLDPARIAEFDGLIVRVMDKATADALVRSGKPVIDTYGRIDSNPLPFVRLDDAAIARMAAQYLSDHRFTNVAYCGFCGVRFSDARGEAFAEYARAAGWRCFVYSDDGKGCIRDTFFRHEHSSRIADAAALRKWLRSLPKPIAVFCCTDLRAYHLMRVCEELGFEIPHDVAVLGVDNDAIFCSFARPSLSSIETNAAKIGHLAAEMLAKALDGTLGRRERAVLHAPERVVERASSNVYQFKTRWMSDAFVFIHRHLGEGISAADVVKHLGYSHTYVNKMFNAELGTSLQREIIRLRLDKACRLLKETDLSAAAISDQCGFLSPQYFSHTFSVTFATTPESYRRRP